MLDSVHFPFPLTFIFTFSEYKYMFIVENFENTALERKIQKEKAVLILNDLCTKKFVNIFLLILKHFLLNSNIEYIISKNNYGYF